MIAYVSGTVLSRGEHGIVVLTPGGVGYEVRLTAPGVSHAPATGETCAYHTLLVVREDAHELYGFDAADERDVFGVLLTIPKLGPKKALAILSMYSPAELARVAATEDLDMLTRVPGIGKKSGQQVLIELKFKLQGITPAFTPAPAAPQAGGVLADALGGLTNLGYSAEEARPALEAVLEAEPDLDVAAALRKALQRLARG